MSDSRLIRGTAILSAAVFASKLLGLLFVIPFEALVGDQGGALFGYAYTPYTIVLSVATLGVPLAVSKFVSKYQALGDYETGRRLFRSGIILMGTTGFIACLVLFFSAGMIADMSLGNIGGEGNRREDVVLVIRMVSVALIIVPVMSLIRGYFQGFQSMTPTAVSQVVEQVVRIGFILVGAFVVITVIDGSITTAVALSTFGAFVGGLGGFAVLIWFWVKRKPFFDQQLAESRVRHDISLPAMYRELIEYAVPFVFVGLAIPIFLMIDQMTVNRALTNFAGFTATQAETVFANLNQYVHKLIMIPVSLSTALAVTLVPTITASFSENKPDVLQRQMTQAFQLVLFLTVPATAGLSVLAYPIYSLLYGVNPAESVQLGGNILQWYAPTAILFALFSVTAAILQGINQQRFAILNLGVGILLKLSFNMILIQHFDEIGAILGTNLGYLAAVLLNLLVIKTYTGFQFQLIARRALLIIIFSFIMVIAVSIVMMISGTNIPTTYGGAVGRSIIGVLVGAAVYLLLSIRSHLAEKIFGDRLSILNRFRGKTKQ